MFQVAVVYYKSCACGHKGEQTFEHGLVDGNNHTGSATRLVNNNNGTHDIVYDCCGAVRNDNVACSAINADQDCTTAETCACGRVVTASMGHSYTNNCDTSCNNSGCLHTRTITHTPSSDDNDCTTDILCSVCASVAIEGNASHTWNNTYSLVNADVNKHYHVCTVSGCTQKDNGVAHTPNIPTATEQQAKTCTECGYVIEAQLGHTHVYNQQVERETYKVSDGTCVSGVVYHKSCVCGDIGEETFTGALDANNHTSQEFSYTSNANGTHIKKRACCNVVIDEDENCVYGADDVCDCCGYENSVTPNITYTVTVENGTISGQNGTSVVVNKDGSVTVNASVAPEGKRFKCWQINGQTVSNESSYTFNVTENLTITAVYEDIAEQSPIVPPTEQPKGLSGGAIAGIVIASVFLLGGGGFATFWFIRKRKR